MPPFRLGINMAGAVSAGAYTAGVLDFLTEALDAWYAAKEKGDPVPRHDVSLEVLSGASAGGMCAAIAAAMIQGDFQHIHDTSLVGTTNTFYESWVNKIDITKLLATDDLAGDGPVLSLLDCTIIDEIAKFALVPGSAKPRAYISPSLTLFLTLTNVSGIPYSLNDVGDGSPAESSMYHADRLRFETVAPGGQASTPSAKPLPKGDSTQFAWPLLVEAAKATGAFPIFLRPRELKRDISDYDIPLWESVNPLAIKKPTIRPSWPPGTGPTIQTINVDGGVINNDPFDLAHDYLASLAPASPDNVNSPAPQESDRAVVTVAPFPAQCSFTAAPDFSTDAAVLAAASRLITVFISQSRFFGESLAKIAAGTFSRFMVAPSDSSLPAGTPALQGGSLGAFGGFFSRGFRAHDFELGRYNCQQFLKVYFALPVSNPIIAAGLTPEVQAKFKVKPPSDAKTELDQDWIPIIPLCTDALSARMATPQRRKMSKNDLDKIIDLIKKRLDAVAPKVLDVNAAIAHVIRAALAVFETLERGKIREKLVSALGDGISDA
jgi:predicted acylesterase/phospholipase RssA